MKFNRFFLLLAALLPLAPVARAQNQSLASIFTNTAKEHRTVVPRRASIIFIACHGLGYGDLSCYGQTNFQTPNLDRLAAEGTRFTDYHVTSDDLSQAQAALMAGNKAAFIPGTSATVADRLHAVGYYTGLCGEWTLGREPWKQGFDEFGGFLNEQDARNYYSDFFERYSPKAIYDATNHTFSPWNKREEIYENTGGRKGKYLPDFFMNAAANFARIHQPDLASHYRPFFLLVNLPAPQSVTPGKDDYPVPTDAPFGDENWPQAAKNRAALMTRLDNDMGQLLEQLSKLGMTNSVAIFFAGAVAPEKFGDTNLNFLQLKGEVRGGTSEDRLRVPMIVHWPGHVPAGRVSSVPWNATDFAPTVLQIAYGKSAPEFTGVSVLPLLLGRMVTNPPAAAHGL
jgi:arylsulfatase A-like enzyme